MAIKFKVDPAMRQAWRDAYKRAADNLPGLIQRDAIFEGYFGTRKGAGGMDKTLTGGQVRRVVGIDRAAFDRWVMAGYIKPSFPGAKGCPPRYTLADVVVIKLFVALYADGFQLADAKKVARMAEQAIKVDRILRRLSGFNTRGAYLDLVEHINQKKGGS